MSKKKYIAPYVILGLSGGDSGNVIGGGTGEGGQLPFPMSYEDWCTSGFQYAYDFDPIGEYSLDEYANWWLDNEFTMEQWAEFNPDHPWNPDWE